MWKKPEEEVLPALEELGIGFIPIVRFAGAIRAACSMNKPGSMLPMITVLVCPRYTPESMKLNRPIIEALIDFGHQRGMTPSQVALGWLLAQKP